MLVLLLVKLGCDLGVGLGQSDWEIEMAYMPTSYDLLNIEATKRARAECREVPYEGDDWFIAEWPDGTWCEWNEREEFGHMSDDYRKARVVTYDPNGYYPLQTVGA